MNGSVNCLEKLGKKWKLSDIISKGKKARDKKDYDFIMIFLFYVLRIDFSILLKLHSQ
jgi:hypothetical protein